MVSVNPFSDKKNTNAFHQYMKRQHTQLMSNSRQEHELSSRFIKVQLTSINIRTQLWK